MVDIEIYDTTLRDGTQGEGIALSVADKLRIAERLDAFGVHYIEGGWPGSNPKDIEFFQQAKHRHVQARASRSVRLHAAQRRPRGDRRSGPAAPRRLDARRHDLRQDVALARPRGPADNAGRKPGHDRRYRAAPQSAWKVRRVRRRARVRRLQGRPRIRARDVAGGRARRRRPCRALRHERRLAAGRDSRDDRVCPWRPRSPGRHPYPRRHRARRGQRPGVDRRGRHPRPGNAQRVWRADRQLQPDERHADPALQVRPSIHPARIVAATEGALAVSGRDGERPAESAPAVGRRGGVLAQGRHARERRAEGHPKLRTHRSGSHRQRAARPHQRSGRPQQHRDEGARAGLRSHQYDAGTA